MRLPVRHAVAAAVCFAFGSTAFALPGSVNPEHPRLYATAANITALTNRLPTGNVLPPEKGTIRFKLTPALRIAGDPVDGMLFGTFAAGQNALAIRHVDSWDTSTGAGEVDLQVAFLDGTTNLYAASTRLRLKPGTETAITVHYDTVGKVVRVTADNGAQMDTISYTDKWPTWKPTEQRFDFNPRSGDVIRDVSITEDVKQTIWSDYDILLARSEVLRSAAVTASAIGACKILATPVADSKSVCDVATAGRNVILGTAKSLALAYRLKADDTFVTAAKKYVDMILAIRGYEKPNYPSGLRAGTEWSMSARVAALGVLYDWFHASLEPEKRAEIREAIRQTIKADIVPPTSTAPSDYPNPDFDLIGMICGSQVGIKLDTTLDCNGTPQIERFYISGHHASAMTGAAVGLLGIAQDSADLDHIDVVPMIDRIYTHLVDGLIPARDRISVDGGHHTVFAYNTVVGETIERLIMWRRALVPFGDLQIAPTQYETKSLAPYIYAMRADGSFPASGDNYDMDVNDPSLGYTALAAATHGDGMATAFYNEHLNKGARWRGQLMWDLLLFPNRREDPITPAGLPLSRHFSVAGNVLMRDSWDYANSTLLDFKSTSFTSENHQHLDQNSFSVYRHAPLLLDSGAYDAYDTTHWSNYYRRTIAHNSVVVYDKDETYLYGNKAVSNDGGQWLKTTQKTYPTLAEIGPNGSNRLDGVTHYKEGGWYAFVTGNASKAYSATKLDQNDGFLRSIVYVRPSTPGGKTSIVVFDRIHTTKLLAATSLLHTAAMPESHAATGTTSPGRIKLVPTQDNQQLLVRNGGGMVTIEPLLPKSVRVTLSGGTDGADCTQVMSDAKQTTVPKDCRFLVRQGGQWVNFAPNTVFDKKDRSDFGAWRIEFSAVDEDRAPPTLYQTFLNVLHVDDNDPLAKPGDNQSRLLASSDPDTVAVEVTPGTVVAFAKPSTPVASLRWKSDSTWKGKVLAAGLPANTCYAATFDTVNQQTVLSVAPAGCTVNATSNEGVLDLTIN